MNRLNRFFLIVSLFVSYDLIGSTSRHFELGDSESLRNSTALAEGCDQIMKSDNVAVKAGGCCLGAGVIATVITCAILYQPYYTHVTNRTSGTIELRYPNGCTYKDSDGNSHARDCEKILYYGDRGTIRSSGKLGHLCAENIWGYGRECTTQKALEQCNDFDVTKHNGRYIFSRACKSNEPTNSSSVSSVVSSAIAQESLKRRKLGQQKSVRDSKPHLRGGNLRGSQNR